MPIEIQDESGDRRYFTIVPNYILNHSTAIDQALYLQMKRLAGEDGRCFATQETLQRKLGVGKQTLKKSLDYLVEHKWIEFIGRTGGKTRPINTYKINDIWKLNSDHYEKISSEMEVSKKDKSQNGSKISSETTPIRRTNIKKNHIISKDITESGTIYGNQDINSLIEAFKKEFDLQVLDGSDRVNRRYAWLMLKKAKSLEVAVGIIKLAASDEFYADKISDFKGLYYKMVGIVQKARGKKDNIIKI